MSDHKLGPPDMSPVENVYNHSRIYRYDPTATDSDLTLQDDRFCAYNVPGNQNDVMGVTNGGGKPWFMESGWSGLSPARLTWFDPNEPAFTDCLTQNALDYGTADSLCSILGTYELNGLQCYRLRIRSTAGFSGTAARGGRLGCAGHLGLSGKALSQRLSTTQREPKAIPDTE